MNLARTVTIADEYNRLSQKIKLEVQSNGIHRVALEIVGEELLFSATKFFPLDACATDMEKSSTELKANDEEHFVWQTFGPHSKFATSTEHNLRQ